MITTTPTDQATRIHTTRTWLVTGRGLTHPILGAHLTGTWIRAIAWFRTHIDEIIEDLGGELLTGELTVQPGVLIGQFTALYVRNGNVHDIRIVIAPTE